MIEQTITVGNIIEITSIFGASLTVFITMKNTVTNLSDDVTRMQGEIAKLAVIVTKMAVTDVRLTNIESDIRELRHGRGFIRASVDREYDDRK